MSIIDKNLFNIPEIVSRVTKTLLDNGFESHIVGGCVRDLILGKKPKDWDVTTNAKPEEIQSLFWLGFYHSIAGDKIIPKDEETARIAREYFTKIHPFVDANGRTGALIEAFIKEGGQLSTSP